MITSTAQLRRYAYKILSRFRDADTGEIDTDALMFAVATRFDELEPDVCQCSDEIEMIPSSLVYDTVSDLIESITKELS